MIGDLMVQGTRTRLPQWIEGRTTAGPFVVRIEVDAIIPDADPTEPCFDAQTTRQLDEALRLADEGDLDALAMLGEVYVRRTA
jgi:hypothetical protein